MMVAALASGCTVPRPATALVPRAVAQVNAACRSLAAVDLARLPKTVPDFSSADKLHNDARTAVWLPQSERTATLLKVAVRGGGVGISYGTSAWAARQPNGEWRVAHVQRLLVGPPPQPPGTPQLRQPPESIVKTGRLKPEAAG
jgi:hypothetical protein